MQAARAGQIGSFQAGRDIVDVSVSVSGSVPEGYVAPVTNIDTAADVDPLPGVPAEPEVVEPVIAKTASPRPRTSSRNTGKKMSITDAEYARMMDEYVARCAAQGRDPVTREEKALWANGAVRSPMIEAFEI